MTEPRELRIMAPSPSGLRPSSKEIHMARSTLSCARLAVALALGLPCTPLLAQQAIADYLATAPSQPVANEAFELAVGFSLLEGAGPLGTPQVLVDGSLIEVVLDSPCAEPTAACDVLVETAASVPVPPLPAGDYLVRVHAGDAPGDDPLREAALVVAVADAVPMARHPAPGYWYDQDRPGTGFSLARKGDVLAITRFDFLGDAGSPATWRQVAATLRRDAIVGVEFDFHDGSCLGCAWQAPTAAPHPGAVQLVFESSRRAWLNEAGREPVALVALPFGADYASETLVDTVDADFGSLPMPALEGRWAFVVDHPDHVQTTRLVEFVPGFVLATPPPGAARLAYEDGAGGVLECGDAFEDRRAGCIFSNATIELDPPPPFPAALLDVGPWFAPLGDIGEDQIRGFAEDGDGNRVTVRGFRIADDGDAAGPGQPQ